MPLVLPGEDRGRPRLVEVLIVVAIVVGLCGLGGCATSTSKATSAQRAHVRPRRVHAPIVAGARRIAAPSQDEGAAFVARALRDSGMRFGTDGSTRALWEYLRNTHAIVDASHARPGDVVFFDTRAGDAAPDCDDATDHAGLVETIEPDGRIIFVEARGGQMRRSVVDPAHPYLRRDARGEIANTFLRAKQVADAPNARYFAGQMLCGIARVDR